MSDLATGRTLILRADASASIGMGHAGRCLGLAEAWENAGGRAILAASGPQTALRIMAGNIGLEWLGEVPPSDDAARFLELAAKSNADMAVLDSYTHDLAFERQVQARLPLLAVDDLASRTHSCDILLDTSLPESQSGRYAGLVPADGTLLLGTDYVMLRQAFLQTVFWPRSATKVGRLMVSFGGSDPKNHSTAALQALMRLPAPPRTDLVLSQANPRLPELRERTAKLSWVRLHIDTTHMAGLMAKADLALGSGGSTSWERCRAGLPTLMTIIADNQLGIAATLAAAGIVRIVRSDDPAQLVSSIASAVETAMADATWRANASRAGMALIDGHGGARIVAEIVNLLASARLGRA